MLTKKFRLNAVNFYQNPQRAKKLSSSFGTLYLKLTNNPKPRFAVVVPVALDKRAVYRNRTKRILIRAIRRHLLRFKKGAEVLIKAGKILQKTDRLSVESELSRLFKKSGLL